MDSIIWNQIHEKYVSYLRNTSTSFPKILVCYSGIPGSGKTTASRVLEDQFEMVRITTDNLRSIIQSLFPQLTPRERGAAAYDYIYHLLHHYPFPNGRIVLDGNIDPRFPDIEKATLAGGFSLFIIRINVSPTLALARLSQRDPRDYERYSQSMDRWMAEHHQLEGIISPDCHWNGEEPLNAITHLLSKRLKGGTK